MEILGRIFIDLIFSFIGWASLSVWYRDRKKVRKIRNEEYAGMYGAAGRIMILNFVAGIGAAFIIGAVIFVLGRWVFRLIATSLS